jgi:molybdenum cofactor sulfurtransferase
LLNADLSTNLYGNPHSASAPAVLSSRALSSVRAEALQFFGVDAEDYDLVFTANATAAIKLVMDVFRDATTAFSDDEEVPRFWYGYHKDCHTSLVGIRNAIPCEHRCFASDAETESWLTEPEMAKKKAGTRVSLLAYPAQSNMTGRKLPLGWAGRARQKTNVFSLLDVSAYAPTSPLGPALSHTDNAPDFAVLSFYKIFGLPDLGGLLVRKSPKVLDLLSRRRYFGGGTVDMVVVLGDSWHVKKAGDVHTRLEDGTIAFHSVVALGWAMHVHKLLYGEECMARISDHVGFLAERLVTGMKALRYPSGGDACVIYGDEGILGQSRGGTVAFNVLRENGTYVEYTEVERLANEKHIYIRAGGLCNPGGIAGYLAMDAGTMRSIMEAGHKCGGGVGTDIINGVPTGVVRASLGAMSTIQDVDTFLTFLQAQFGVKWPLKD